MEKKKQHYVPQFYLRNFSWGRDRLPINLFNIQRGENFTAGNLKGQCYEDYFYGKDLVIENQLGSLEGRVAPVIDRIIENGEPPIHGSMDHQTLVEFVLFQYARTKHSGETANEQISKLAKAVLSKDSSIEREYLEAVKISLKSPFTDILWALNQNLPMAQDLQIKIAINRTPIRFITSDHPVVFYNKYCERRIVRSNTGIASKGLQIFYPVSPTHMAILYDGEIYKIGKRKSFSADITSISDVEQLNDLQWLNALENLFFDNTQPLTEIHRGYNRNAARRSPDKIAIKEFEPKVNHNGMLSSAFMMAKLELKVNLQLDFLKCLRSMPDEERTFAGVLVRDPERAMLHDEFLRTLDEGRYKASEFEIFLSDRAASRMRLRSQGTPKLVP